MKRIVLIGVIALVAFCIYAVFTHPHPRRAPPGVYFTVIHLPVRSGSALTGVEPGGDVVLVAAKQLPSMSEARALEGQLKRKKNPQLTILALNQKDNLTE